MDNTILTKSQTDLLKAIGRKSELAKLFYLTGGTALAGFYIPYRYSEDLDFFSEKEVDTLSIHVFLKTVTQEIGISAIESQTSLNRNLFFLTLTDKTILKTEFTYFPFAPIEERKLHDGVQVDSPIDIATNKLFTIYQRTKARDYMDLYMLCKIYHYTVAELVGNARLKFDSHIDLLKLGTQFNNASEVKDFPRLVTNLPEQEWQSFFQTESDKLKPEILGF